MLIKSYRVTVLALLLASCAAPPPRTPPALPASQPPLGAAVYRIDAASSELRLLVYKAGAMARLGHNHVILNGKLGGWVAITPGESSFWLEVPAGGFVVDDAGARAAEGTGFAADVPDEAKAGTLHNMLGAALLNADRYPDITVRSLRVRDAAEMSATLSIRLAGRESTLTLPFELRRGPGRVVATGAVTVRQSALGLTPFSVMLGALQVQDEFTLKFRIVALAA